MATYNIKSKQSYSANIVVIYGLIKTSVSYLYEHKLNSSHIMNSLIGVRKKKKKSREQLEMLASIKR